MLDKLPLYDLVSDYDAVLILGLFNKVTMLCQSESWICALFPLILCWLLLNTVPLFTNPATQSGMWLLSKPDWVITTDFWSRHVEEIELGRSGLKKNLHVIRRACQYRCHRAHSWLSGSSVKYESWRLISPPPLYTVLADSVNLTCFWNFCLCNPRQLPTILCHGFWDAECTRHFPMTG